MKTKSKIIKGSIIIGIVVFLVVCYILTGFKIEIDRTGYTEYDTIRMTNEKVSLYNSNLKEILDDMILSDAREIPFVEGKDYGNLVKLYMHINVYRYIPINDCIVGYTIDYSSLDDSEKIFFSESFGDTGEEYLAQCNGGDNPAPTYVSLYGCTYGKSQEEICDIAKKIKITMITKNKLGHIRKKKIDMKSIEFSPKEYDEEDVESRLNIFKLQE